MSGATQHKILLASLLYAALAASAFAGEWKIVQAAGDYRMVSDGVQPVSLEAGSGTLPDGTTFVTGKNGRAVLARGPQTMTVGPNSAVTLPKTAGQLTTVAQRAGSVSFDVDKQDQPHFAVETPFLAAVVKGTAFTVDVGPESAAVAVSRGLVEVANLATGEIADVTADQRAAVASPTARLTVGGGTIAVRAGAPRAPAVPPLSAGALGALQSGAGAAPSGLTPLTPETSASAGRDTTVLASAAVGAGGGGNDVGGSGTGGGSSGSSGGSGGSGAGSLGQNLAFASSAANHGSPSDESPTVILAATVAVTALLGFLLAVLRARFG